MEILHEMIVRGATPEKVYQFLTTESGLNCWLADDARFIQDGLNSLLELRYDRGQTVIRAEVIEEIPSQKVTWKILQGMPAWQGTLGTITWTLRRADRGTFVHFRHNGWFSNKGAFPSVSFKWAWFMVQLKNFLQAGNDLP